jgi:hypothetical protein
MKIFSQAGFTPVMLASLATMDSDVDRAIAARLFSMGDINRRATEVSINIKYLNI